MCFKLEILYKNETNKNHQEKRLYFLNNSSGSKAVFATIGTLLQKFSVT